MLMIAPSYFHLEEGTEEKWQMLFYISVWQHKAWRLHRVCLQGLSGKSLPSAWDLWDLHFLVSRPFTDCLLIWLNNPDFVILNHVLFLNASLFVFSMLPLNSQIKKRRLNNPIWHLKTPILKAAIGRSRIALMWLLRLTVPSSSNKPTMTKDNFTKFLNEKQRDSRLNEELFPRLRQDQIKALIDKYEPCSSNSNRSESHWWLLSWRSCRLF